MPRAELLAMNDDRSELPVSLPWYRDAANWIVGLSTGAFAGSMAYFDKFVLFDRGSLVVFLLTGAAFLIAIVLGVWFYLSVIYFGNQREFVVTLTRQREATVGDRDRESISRTIAKHQGRRDHAQKRIGRLYLPMIGAFYVGLGLLVFSTLIYVCNARSAGGTWVMQSAVRVQPERTADSKSVIILELKSGETLLIVEGAKDRVELRRIRQEPAKK
jgi:hypothetical protein